MKHPIFKNSFDSFCLVFLSVFLLTSFVILVRYVLATLNGLPEALFNWVKLILTEESLNIYNLFQFGVIFKFFSLIISGGLIFIVYSVLSAVFSCIFYSICSKDYKKISHPLKYSLLKGIRWNFYRIFLVLSPPLFVKTAVFLLFFILIGLFNILLKIAGISISLTTFILTFIILSLIFMFMFSLLFSFWNLFTTIFGTEIAVSEPRLTLQAIEKRSKKLIFSRKSNILLCLGFITLVLSIIFQIKYGFVSNLFLNSQDSPALNSFIIFNLLFILAFEYFKSYSYIDSLLNYSNKISKCPVKTVKS